MITIPGAYWNSNQRLWRVPLTWAACLQLRGVFGADLQIDESVLPWAWDQQRRYSAVLELRELLELDPDDEVAKAIDQVEASSTLLLKPFQRAAVAYLVKAEQAGLFDPMGVGKTVIMIRTIQVLKELGRDPLPVLVICPNSLKHTVWAREFQRWAPELLVQVVDGSASVRRKQIEEHADVTVVNWDAVRLHSRLAPYGNVRLTDKQKEVKELNELGHTTIIMDEAHRLRSIGTAKKTDDEGNTITVPQSQQALAVWAVAAQAKYRYALTGTPVNNHVGDLYGLLHAVKPDWFPTKTKYLDRYAQTSFGLWGGMEVVGINPVNRDEFHKITDPLFRRIPKEVSLPQLPPKLPPAYRYTDMTPKQARAYRQMETMLMAALNQLLVAPNPLSQLTRLAQFAAASAEVTGRDEEGRAVVKLSNPSAKVDDLLELLDELGDEPLAVCAVSRQLIELVAARLDKEKISHGLITGAIAPFDRAQAIERFQAGKLRVILFTLGAGAEGITLTRANKLLFMQRSFSPLQNNQGEDRVHRIGSEIHDHVQIIHQVTPNTIEERVLDLLDAKNIRIEEVVRDRETLARLLGATQ